METAQKLSSPKAAKGSIQVEVFRGRLRLRLPRNLCGGEQKRISLGLQDTPENALFARRKAQQIELDISLGQFDETLERYMPPKPTKEIQINRPQTPTLDYIWKRYVEAHPDAKPSTRRMYRWIDNHIQRLPTRKLNKVGDVIAYLNRNTTPDVRKRLLVRFNAACELAVQESVLESNPFTGKMNIAAIRKELRKIREDEDYDIQPFTPDEAARIVRCFEQSFYSGHYAPLIRFLFSTGCRPGEALGLQFRHINFEKGHIRFQQVLSLDEEGRPVIVPGLKTQPYREFPINDQLREFLMGLKPTNPEGYLFLGSRGKFISLRNFARRHWYPVLRRLGIEERRLYQTRHTFITRCLKSGLGAEDIAKWVGNSAEIIYRHYAGASPDIQVPEL